MAASAAPLAATLSFAFLLACASPVAASTEAASDSAAASRAPAGPAGPWPPASWPSDLQASSPSINSASPDLVDRCGLPAVAAVAWDERVQEGPNDRAITIGLTPLAIARAMGRGHEDGAASAAGCDPLARAEARVTLGGPLQKFDPHRVGRAERPTNHVTTELKLILHGNDSPDRSPHPTLVGLALGADNVGTGYGLDRYGATLMAERAGACTWTANAGYRVVERYHALRRAEEAKLAVGAQWRLFAIGGRPVDLEVADGCLLPRFHAATWQEGARLDLSLAHAWRVSIAGRRSSRPELRGEDTSRGVVSVAYDMGGSAR